MPLVELTNGLAARGWVLRRAEKDSAPILVRGAMVTDHPLDYQVGFVYAETAEAAEIYDRQFGYGGPNGDS